MKHSIIYILAVALTLTAIHGCGPDEEELLRQQQAEEQARLDSLQRVMQAEAEQARQDSIREAREARIAEAEAAAEQEERERRERERAEAITYSRDGAFTVQVRSWRSEEKAEEHAQLWRGRGFEHVYVTKYGDESVGDVWFRVRLGNVPNYTMAQRLRERVEREHRADAWIASTRD